MLLKNVISIVIGLRIGPPTCGDQKDGSVAKKNHGKFFLQQMPWMIPHSEKPYPPSDLYNFLATLRESKHQLRRATLNLFKTPRHFTVSSLCILNFCKLYLPAHAFLSSRSFPNFSALAQPKGFVLPSGFEMARTKITSNPPPTVAIDYRALYPWASEDLLAETSKLTSCEDLRKHRDDENEIKGRVFGRETDAYVSVRPSTVNEPVCADDRCNDGEPFFFFYATIFKRVKVRLPFTGFERALLTELNVAPAQLHPNSWAFIRAFSILCNNLGFTPSVDVFLYFFEAKSPGKRLWVSLNGVAGRVLLTLFSQSYKNFKGRFFRVCCSSYDPTMLDGFPLYWVGELKFKKPRKLEELTAPDRELCQTISSWGVVFDSTQLIRHEFDAETLSVYLGIPTSSCIYLFARLIPCLSHIFVLFTAGMVLSADKKKRLADVLSRRNAGGLAPAGPSSPAGAALDRIADKSKRAAPVEVSDDEDTCSGLVFKRKRVGTATEVSSATEGHPSSFREHPPSASSPPEPILTIEGGGESAPSSDQMPSAPELPSLLQRSLSDMPGKAVLEAMDRNSLENLLSHGLGEFLAASNSLLVKGNAEAELLEETAQLKKELEQKDLQLRQATQRETALNQELGSLRQSEKETKKLLFSKGQEALQLEAKILPLRNKIIELEEQAEGAQAKMIKLEERATDREVQLGKVEEELAQQLELLRKTEAELIDDAADAYGEGFGDALAQVACVHPEMDLSPYSAIMQVVDGQIVPR
ncbi:hypothetical protein VNO80_29229 [Phaseolus coccineus]|uniref:Transposase (putative) gypsy type domain-containing protein n=1 Tax=Phaseolus coccineus TaxID=3886 RepID=A0AAN9QEQ3_PHACN